MKKTIIFSILLCLLLSTSVFADFSTSLRRQATATVMEDDWDYLMWAEYMYVINPNFIHVSMDNIQYANSFQAGTGLGLFGMKQALAVRYAEGSQDRLDTVDTKEEQWNGVGDVNTMNHNRKKEETIDSINDTEMDILVGWMIPMGDMNMAANFRIMVDDADQEDEWMYDGKTDDGDGGNITGVDNSTNLTKLVKDTDKTYALQIGGNMKGFMADNFLYHAEFQLNSYKGDGSTGEQTVKAYNTDEEVTGQEVYKMTGDYENVEGNPQNLDNIAMSGTTMRFYVVLDYQKTFIPLQPMLYLSTSSRGVVDDEKDITLEKTLTGYYVGSGNVQSEDITNTKYSYDVQAFSDTEIIARNHSIFKLKDGNIIGFGLEYVLNTKSREYTVTKTQTVETKRDVGDDGSFSDTGDTDTVTTSSGDMTKYVQDQNTHTLRFPIFAELAISKTFVFRVGTRISWKFADKTTTEVLDENGYTKYDFVDNNNSSNDADGNLTHTTTTTTDTDTTSDITKQFFVGFGWEAAENVSVDMLLRTAAGADAIGDQVSVSGTARF